MNGKAAQLERWLMAIRQRALVRSGDLVGQVPCDGDNVGSSHEFWIPRGYACPACKAAL